MELGQRIIARGPERTEAPHVLSPELQRQHEALWIVLQRALWLAEKCADDDATQILRKRLDNLQAAALLVIVGEVKAGKSSFVNALVREPVCEVAPGPCTTRIQELVYGAERSVASLGPSTERVHLPKEVLREITIVDTPGTNSIIKDHQTITENYIPQSDLVVFVFSAVNPHTKSAWELLTLIRKEWHRKMVFVLQQADRASRAELTTNLEHVRQYARERHVEAPVVFTLSAKSEMEGQLDLGFSQFRHFLQDAIARGDVWRMKVEGSYQTITKVTGKLLTHLRAEKEAVAVERAFYQELLEKVKAREAKATLLRELIVAKLSATYDRLADESEREFMEDLSAGKVFRRAIPFLRDRDLKSWLEDLESGFQRSAMRQIAIEAPQLTQDLFEEMQTMMTELAEGIARKQEGMRENAPLPQTHDRLAMLAQLKSKLERIHIAEKTVRKETTAGADVRKLSFAACAVAVIGIIIVFLAPSFWLQVSGGVLAAVGLVLAVVGLSWGRSDLLRDFRQKLADSRKDFRERLESEFDENFEGFFLEVNQALAETIFRLDLEASHLTPVLEETFRIGEAASEMLLNFQRSLSPAVPTPLHFPLVPPTQM